MSTVEELKQNVIHLSKDDLAAFRDWFTEYDAKIWDHQIEEDIHAGKLDKLANEAIQEFRAGRYTEL